MPDTRADLVREMTHQHLYMTEERAGELIDAHEHALANRLRAQARILRQGFMTDAATQFEKAADLIDPKAVDRD